MHIALLINYYFSSIHARSESVLVQQVVEDVISKLQSISSTSIDDFKGLFGIPRQLCEIESLLCFDSQNVRILGIWGMGGIGKTTLARVVFERFSNRFERTCLLESVREESERKGLVELEKEVFSKLLGEKDPDVNNSFVKVRLSRTKALLVLDDVDRFEQLTRLAGDRDRFGPGSKIILTSRDLQVLNQLIDVRYKVQALDLKNEASQLFYLEAFKENSCRTGFEEISHRVVGYTKGHPLALRVLGASFCSLESIEEWEEELEKLKRIPKDEIQAVLKRSYDALDDEEKGLFLDIACFFKGMGRDFVEGILEGKPIRGLVSKSLITIEGDRIHVHDLIEEMGRKLGERSRLWIGKDFSDVLENNKGTEAIEGIYLPWIKEEVHLRSDVFKEMCKLRLLKMPSFMVYIDGDLKYLPNSLRYLSWENYPGKSLSSNFKPQNLVTVHMPNSKLEQLWDGVQKLGSLKHIDLHGSKLLTKIPDLSLAPKLECINLSCCESLIHIPSLNLNLQATMDESACRHQWLRVEDEVFGSRDERTPRCIILNGCLSLMTLLKVSGNIRKLVLRETALKELPSSIQSLENLLFLDLRQCMKLKSLPKLPRNIEELHLDHSGIEQIPSSSIEGLCSLRILSFSHCQSLSSLQFNIDLKALERLSIEDCDNLQSLPASIGKLYNLESLVVSFCDNLQSLPASIGMLYNLENLSIIACKNLQSLPASIGMLYKLKSLVVCYCENLQSLPASIGKLYNLESLVECYCENLQSLPASIGMLYKLKRLYIRGCKNLQSLPASIGKLYNLEMLYIEDCENLQSLPELPLFIVYVNVRDCSSLEMVSSLRSTLTLGRWFDKCDSDYYGCWREFSFSKCTKLGEDAMNNIFREFLYKVFCTATTLPEVAVSKRAFGELVCYPTEEIPRWFNNQSEGSSITITLPPNWYNPKTFLGFVVSVVVFKDEDDHAAYFRIDHDSARVECELCLMTNKDRFGVDVLDGPTTISFDHILMCYTYFDHSKENFEKYQEACLKFESNYGRVKRCGVRMLYLKDAVEESDDGTTANFESWRIDSDTDYATTYDSDEPPPKRTRNL